METFILANKEKLGLKAARKGAELIREAIVLKGSAHIVVATGASQFEMLSALVKEDIDWGKVTAFHLDEYVGVGMSHLASFRKYLKERFVDIVSPAAFHYVDGENDPFAECERLKEIILQHQIDVAFVGIGENGHLAFNDPPADFETVDPFILVDLDEDCRMQQLGEGWFKNLDEVPRQALSMSIKQILKSRAIICSVPDGRKVRAVRNTLEALISPMVPATALRGHDAVFLYLDQYSSALVSC